MPQAADIVGARPRIGFLGVGWIGRARMEALIGDGCIDAVAIVEPDDAMAGAALALAPAARRLDTLDALLDLGIDGVVIATPSALHAEQAIRALDRGVAVFCQKPLGRTAAEVDAVVSAARRADRLLGLDLSYRHTAAAEAIRTVLDSGEIGRIHAVDLVFHNAYGPNKGWFFDSRLSGGGCVMDLGVHLVDLALWMLGFPEVLTVDSTLFAGGEPLVKGDGRVEDYAVATLVLATGTVVRLACSWNLPAGRDAVIEASFYSNVGGLALRNLDGSFYDFAADRYLGTRTERLVSPPDAWGGRAAIAWARALATDRRFDPSAMTFTTVATALDRIYRR